jgi:hypothetical protein
LPASVAQAVSINLDSNAKVLATNLQKTSRDESFSIFAKQTISGFSRIVSEYGIGDSTSIEKIDSATIARIDSTNVDKIDYDKLAERVRKISFEVVTGVVEKQSIDQVEVIAESYRLREQRPQDIIYIKMKVNEDGLEWQTIQRDDGSIERKLLPE